ncbi:MAG: ACT domain-containing protein [Clostridia bacterium]|nr:ACT domain-containing protein [Clostridia bacterium]
MPIKQLNIFLENKNGSLAKVTEILGKEGINIVTMVLADTADYGILRLIVSDTEKAVNVLNQHGILAKATGITVIRMQHVRGGLDAVLRIMQEENISIEYLYAFVAVSGREAYAVIRFEDKDAGLHVLEKNNIPLLTEASLFED